MARKVAPVLAEMLDAVEGIEDTVAGVSFETYASVWRLRAAVERGLEIISEASKHLPDELKAQYGDINWAQVQAIGDILRHEYHKIRDEVIWDVVDVYLPPLKAALRDMRDKISE